MRACAPIYAIQPLSFSLDLYVTYTRTNRDTEELRLWFYSHIFSILEVSSQKRTCFNKFTCYILVLTLNLRIRKKYMSKNILVLSIHHRLSFIVSLAFFLFKLIFEIVTVISRYGDINQHLGFLSIRYHIKFFAYNY